MSDLEDLKQQLYAKIQATQKPEQPPSEGDLLKYSQLPAYEASQKLHSLLKGGDRLDEAHDVALNHLLSITGKVHPPLAAF